MKSAGVGSAKTVLVTGSSRGIGRGIAVSLAAAGFSVAVNYAGNEPAAEETLVLCRKAAVSDSQIFLAFKADISQAGDRARLIENVISTFGDFHGLVNNAGVASC